MSGEHDDLLARLRAADPARAARPVGEERAADPGRAARPVGADGAADPARGRHAAGPAPHAEGRLRLVAPGERGGVPAGLHAVAAARRRHVRGRLAKMAAATTALACAASGAFAIGLPTGAGDGRDSGLRVIVPSLTEVAARAKAASRLQARSILWYRSDVRWGTPGEELVGQRRTTVLRTDERGRVIVMRAVSETDPAYQRLGLPATLDSVSHAGPDGGLRGSSVREWSSETGRVRSFGGMMVEEIVHRTSTLLRAAERRAARRGGVVEVVTHAGRPAYRLEVGGIEERRFPGEERFLLIDAETYAPVMLGVEQAPLARGPYGRPIAPYRYREEIEQIRELEDTAENRRLLELRGPLP